MVATEDMDIPPTAGSTKMKLPTILVLPIEQEDTIMASNVQIPPCAKIAQEVQEEIALSQLATKFIISKNTETFPEKKQ